MENLIGQRIGQYDIVALLGEGGMASVYRAQQASVGREVALKVIRSHLIHEAEFIERFKREARTVAALSHPHIVKVFDYGQQDQIVYLVMELLTSGSLSDLIRSGELSTRMALRIFGQIASALNYAHERGIIHRDLKSNNVLLDDAGNSFLTDFGLAKLLTDSSTLTQTGMAMGTPPYMAPELWMADMVDTRVDVYALGVLLFEMLTGSLPFTGETVAHMMHSHIYQPVPSICERNPRLPATLDAVIARALAKNADDRFRSVGEFAVAVKATFAGKVLSTPSSSTTIILSPPVRGRPARRFLGILSAALLLLLLGGMLLIGLPARSGNVLPTSSALPQLGVPTETPTLTETLTPILPTLTATPTATNTLTSSVTATITLTHTPSKTPTYTATATITPSPTRTPNLAGTQNQQMTRTIRALGLTQTAFSVHLTATQQSLDVAATTAAGWMTATVDEILRQTNTAPTATPEPPEATPTMIGEPLPTPGPSPTVEVIPTEPVDPVDNDTTPRPKP